MCSNPLRASVPVLVLVLLLLIVNCGTDGTPSPVDALAGADSSTSLDAALPDATTADSDGGSTSDLALTADGSVPPPAEIASWTDAPGTCPQGLKRVELSTVQSLIDASRGDGPYVNDPPETCYFIKNGTYNEGGQLLLYVLKGGSVTGARRFVGESRGGVIIHGRANVFDKSDHVVFENMTFDLTGYGKSGSFNTFDLSAATDVTLSHMTFTGDCKTGLRGGHVEVNSGTHVLIDSCLIERFGHCASGGHEDHGVYLASGSDITVRNSDIRGNSSRGILFNTQQGSYGKLKGVLIEYNRIHDNGHGDYEDGIAVNMEGTGNVDDVTIRRNLIYGNYYSGLRFVGSVTSGFDVSRNTFHNNGARSMGNGRSNLNLDDVGSGGKTLATKNVFTMAKAMLNDCYDATPRGFSVDDNVVNASVNVTGGATCVTKVVSVDPMYKNGAAGDFHPGNVAVAGYGAY